MKKMNAEKDFINNEEDVRNGGEETMKEREFGKVADRTVFDKEFDRVFFKLIGLINEIEEDIFLSEEKKEKAIERMEVNDIEHLLMSPVDLETDYYKVYDSLLNSEKLSTEQKEEIEKDYRKAYEGLSLFNALNDEDDDDGNPPKPEFYLHCVYVNKFEKLCEIHENLIGNL